MTVPSEVSLRPASYAVHQRSNGRAAAARRARSAHPSAFVVCGLDRETSLAAGTAFQRRPAPLLALGTRWQNGGVMQWATTRLDAFRREIAGEVVDAESDDCDEARVDLPERAR